MLTSLSSQPLWMVFLTLVALFAYGFLCKPASWARLVLLCAWLAHGAVALGGLLTLRFGFGPALSVTAWLALSIYSIESHWYPQLRIPRTSALLGAVAVSLGLLFPGQTLHPAASLWLPLHGALGMAAYGLLALAVWHAMLMRRAEGQMRTVSGVDFAMPILTLERLMFSFAAASWVLLGATLLAGWLFSESLYRVGYVWRWNHKSVFSLLAWVMLTILLMGRWQWGWRGKHAARWVYGSAGLLMLAYVGSRFVFEVLLGRNG